MVALLQHLMTMAWDMWQHCNKALHESDENKQAIVEADINQQIRQAYEQDSPTLPPAAKPLMWWPLAKILQFPATYKCQWMATLRAVHTWVHNLVSSPQVTTCARRRSARMQSLVDLWYIMTVVQHLSADLAMPDDIKPWQDRM